MAKLSSILLPTTAGSLNITGSTFKGAGYRNIGSGLHTVSIHTNSCTGRVYIEGSLATEPESTDWFPIQIDGATDYIEYTASTDVDHYTFNGNYIWIRARLDRTYNAGLNLGNAGSLDKVILSF